MRLGDSIPAEVQGRNFAPLFFDEKAKAEIFEELEKDYISGITFSGGDPLHSANAYEVMMLAKEIKEKFPSKTSGFTPVMNGKISRIWIL